MVLRATRERLARGGWDLFGLATDLIVLVVVAGAFVQTTTGLGMGVIAGPVLMQVRGYEQGVFETAALCLIASVACIFRDAKLIERREALILCAALAPGMVLGVALRLLLDEIVLLWSFGLLLIGFGASLVWRRQTDSNLRASAAPRSGWRAVALGGTLAGVGATLFAAPGPPAAWGLTKGGLDARAVRGTLSAYFIPAYVLLVILACLLAPAAVSPALVHLPIEALACLVGVGVAVVIPFRLGGVFVRDVVALLTAGSGLLLLLRS